MPTSRTDGTGSGNGTLPQAAATLSKLALTNAEFREICEEYALAQQSLAGFEARLDAGERPEIGGYRTLIAEPAEGAGGRP